MSRPDDLVRAVEATLFAAEEAMTAEAISPHLGGADVKAALAELAETYKDRGIQLVERAKRWHFQTAPELAHLLRRERGTYMLCRRLLECFKRVAGFALEPVKCALHAIQRVGLWAAVKGPGSSTISPMSASPSRRR